MLELYEETEIDRHLGEDADRLRNYLGEEPSKGYRPNESQTSHRHWFDGRVTIYAAGESNPEPTD